MTEEQRKATAGGEQPAPAEEIIESTTAAETAGQTSDTEEAVEETGKDGITREGAGGEDAAQEQMRSEESAEARLAATGEETNNGVVGAQARNDAGDALLAEIESLKFKVQENLDKAVRATAELDNMRKRTARDIENAHKYALERFVRALLPVLDSMQLGINASASADNADSVDSLKEGMDLTLKLFTDCLDKSGVTAHDPLGQPFNPEFHQAVSMIEQEGMESGKVISVMQKGYDLNGRLLRPAMVVVAK